ncbi:unnamed protein product [Callosobruchus maculatus]|uniref:RNase H type-1 domain-containing protein n=1 Tax=Callosobruchus maculatus TaxID=64391 RepID=A0A653CKJ2_CALMS|nr:unnamed protein product [Callosobruchus maculatus]
MFISPYMAAEISIPRQNRFPGRKTVPWWNQDIEQARRDKRQSFKELIRSPTEARFIHFKQQRAKLRRYRPVTTIYTDGSKSNSGVGAAVVGEGEIWKGSLNSMSSIYTAELTAIYQALIYVHQNSSGTYLICSDSLSSLQSIKDTFSTDPLVQKIIYLNHALQQQSKTVTFIWTPGHVGILGNQAADAITIKPGHIELEKHSRIKKTFPVPEKHRPLLQNLSQPNGYTDTKSDRMQIQYFEFRLRCIHSTTMTVLETDSLKQYLDQRKCTVADHNKQQKYVYKNPVCIKATKKKTCAMATAVKHKSGEDEIVTKEYLVEDKEQSQRNGKQADLNDEDDESVWSSNLLEAHYDPYEPYEDIQETRDETFNDFLAPSEVPLYSSRKNTKTPNLSGKKVYDMLIEDRLDQLETILPHYVRRRVYQTSTITMTKVLNNRRSMATLVVKNCIPPGYQFCVTKNKKRKSKVAQFTNNSNESLFYFG